MGRLFNPLQIDIGPGNFNYGVAIHQTMQYLDRYPREFSDGDPLGLDRYIGNYDQLYYDMINPRSDATIKMVGLRISAAQDFYLRNSTSDAFGAQLREYYLGQDDVGRDRLLTLGYQYRESTIYNRLHDQYKVGQPLNLNLVNTARSGYDNYFVTPGSPYWTQREILLGSR